TVNSQISLSISISKFSIMKKILSSYFDIQCYYCKKKDHIVRNCSAKLFNRKYQELLFKYCMKRYNKVLDEVINHTLTSIILFWNESGWPHRIYDL
ncbi:hypothetical protein GX48_07700, partial [Paracoccidioides brasiliensis]